MELHHPQTTERWGGADSDARKTTVEFLGATQETTSETTQESSLTRHQSEDPTVKFYLIVAQLSIA